MSDDRLVKPERDCCSTISNDGTRLTGEWGSSRKSDTAAAIKYALNLWPALTRYCDDGRIEIANSAAGHALRGLATDRRNDLFASAVPISE